jgi:3'-5' exoribonuclease
MPKDQPAPALIELLPLHRLPVGVICDCFALLVDATTQQTRDGKHFVSAKFQDRLRSVQCAIWADHALFEKGQKLNAGGFYKLRGTFVEHPRYGPTLELLQLRELLDTDKTEGFRESDFYECSRFDPEAMFAEVMNLALAEIKDEPLRNLVVLLLNDNRLSLLRLPATEKHFYPYPGGWLEHVLNVSRNVLPLIDSYNKHHELAPALNRDLILAGAMLHDIGRVREYQLPATPLLPISKTVEGQLFGHIDLARKMIREGAAAVPELNPELLLLLDHLVHTHLSLPEWGSPRLPAIPEVLILHHVDDLDAKMEMYARHLQRDPGPGPMTESDPILRRVLLKARTV